MKNFIKVHPTVILIALLPCFGILNAGQTVLLWVSAAMHECGHVFAAKKCGAKFHRLILLPIGIAAVPENGALLSPNREILIAAAGPAVNAVMALLTAILPLPVNEYTVAFLYDHFAQFFVNILPILPLDGGRILYYFLARKYDAPLCETVCRRCAAALLIVLFLPCVIILVGDHNPSFLLVWCFLAIHTVKNRGAI